MLRIDNLKMYKTSKFIWNLSKDTKTLKVLKQGTKVIVQSTLFFFLNPCL